MNFQRIYFDSVHQVKNKSKSLEYSNFLIETSDDGELILAYFDDFQRQSTLSTVHISRRKCGIENEQKNKNVYKSGLLEVEMCISQRSANTLPAAEHEA